MDTQRLKSLLIDELTGVKKNLDKAIADKNQAEMISYSASANTLMCVIRSIDTVIKESKIPNSVVNIDV